MDVIDAIEARHSVRDFKADPVPEATIMKILEVATRSPSGGNSQPWEIFVAAGAIMERIRQAYKERYEKGIKGAIEQVGPPSTAPRPTTFTERMQVITKERLELLKLDPKEPNSRKVFMEWGARLFGAPVLILLCMDRTFTVTLNIGILTQSICLAAQNFGVESFIASAFVSHPDVLRKELEIPDDLIIVIGIGLGYPNEENIINTYRSPRRPIQEVVRYKS